MSQNNWGQQLLDEERRARARAREKAESMERGRRLLREWVTEAEEALAEKRARGEIPPVRMRWTA